MDQSNEPGHRGRGKVRDEGLRGRILWAAGSLLLEVGYKKFTIEGVAARAEASKVTIYKWWPTKGALALDGFVDQVTESITFPQTDSPRADVEAQLAELIRQLTTTSAGRALVELIGAAQEDPELKRELRVRYIQPRRDLARTAFARFLGWDPETREAEVRAVQDQVYGAVYNRLLFGLEPLDEGFARQLVAFWAPKTS